MNIDLSKLDVAIEAMKPINPDIKPRMPKFKGTEDTKWDDVDTTFKGFYNAYYKRTGKKMPDEVCDQFGECPIEVRTWMTEHSILGDPDAKIFKRGVVLPVVNPATGKLNSKGIHMAKIFASRIKGISKETLEATKKILKDLYDKNFKVKGSTESLDVEVSEEGLVDSIKKTIKRMFDGLNDARKAFPAIVTLEDAIQNIDGIDRSKLEDKFPGKYSAYDLNMVLSDIEAIGFENLRLASRWVTDREDYSYKDIVEFIKKEVVKRASGSFTITMNSNNTLSAKIRESEHTQESSKWNDKSKLQSILKELVDRSKSAVGEVKYELEELEEIIVDKNSDKEETAKAKLVYLSLFFFIDLLKDVSTKIQQQLKHSLIDVKVSTESWDVEVSEEGLISLVRKVSAWITGDTSEDRKKFEASLNPAEKIIWAHFSSMLPLIRYHMKSMTEDQKKEILNVKLKYAIKIDAVFEYLKELDNYTKIIRSLDPKKYPNDGNIALGKFLSSKTSKYKYLQVSYYKDGSPDRVSNPTFKTEPNTLGGTKWLEDSSISKISQLVYSIFDNMNTIETRFNNNEYDGFGDVAEEWWIPYDSSNLVYFIGDKYIDGQIHQVLNVSFKEIV